MFYCLYKIDGIKLWTESKKYQESNHSKHTNSPNVSNSSNRFENGLTVDRSKNSEAMKLFPREFFFNKLPSNTEINLESVQFRGFSVLVDDLNVVYANKRFKTGERSILLLKQEVVAILYPLTENSSRPIKSCVLFHLFYNRP